MTNALQLEAVEPVIETIEIGSINRDVQVRVKTDRATVEDYARALAADPPATMPPVVVFRDKRTGALWLSDGNHRLEARLKNGETTIEAEIRDGGKREALAYAVGSSKGHGLRFSNADKRNAVGLALKDSKLKKNSDNALAALIGVSQPFVSKLRAELITVIPPEPQPEAEPSEAENSGKASAQPSADAILMRLVKRVTLIVAQCPEEKRIEMWAQIGALFEGQK